MTIDDLTESHPRLALMDEPTPLQRVDDLGRGVTIWLKRDDMGRFVPGGNKLRKLEFLVARAIADKCDTLLTCGAVQSNHARLTAAVAASLGLRCRLLLAPLVDNVGDEYQRGGNALLDDLLGAECVRLAPGQDIAAALEDHHVALSRAGRRPFTVPFGGSDWLGSLGYAICAREIAAQAKGQFVPAAIYVACGSGGTVAGLAAAAPIHLPGSRIVAVCVAKDRLATTARIEALVSDIDRQGGRFGADGCATVTVTDGFLGEGYGLPTASGMAAIRRIAGLTGVILDPVYTGKAMAALLDDVERGVHPPGSHLVLLHTGGLPGVFAYASQFAR